MRPNTSTEAGCHESPARETAAQPHPDATLAEAALASTRLAIARWTGGIHLPQMLVPGMVRVSPQARWYAQANNGFQEWVSQGGFAQAFDAATQHETSGCVAVLCSAPLRNADNENADACMD